MISVPSGSTRKGMITSCTSIPMRSADRVALGEPALDPHLVAELHHPDAVGPEGLERLPARRRAPSAGTPGW